MAIFKFKILPYFNSKELVLERNKFTTNICFPNIRILLRSLRLSSIYSYLTSLIQQCHLIYQLNNYIITTVSITKFIIVSIFKLTGDGTFETIIRNGSYKFEIESH